MQLRGVFAEPAGGVVRGVMQADRLRLGIGKSQSLGAGRVGLPKTQRGVGHCKDIAQQMGDYFLQGVQIAPGKQGNDKLMHLVLQRVVLLCERHHFAQVFFQYFVFFAQRNQLSFAQRNRASAVGVREIDLHQRFDMFLKELRVVMQILCDFFSSHVIISYMFISPVNTVIAGPVICTSAASPSHEILNEPPRVATFTGLSSKLRRMPATTAAHAPVPHDKVSPAPRSYTRRRILWRSITCMNPALTRLGKRGWRSMSGPNSFTGACSISSTSCTACGLPIDSALMRSVLPSTSRGSLAAPLPPSNGICEGSKIGAPMFTVTRPSCSRRGLISPLCVSTTISRLAVSFWSWTKRMKQRAPLPHCSTSPPSELKIR